MVLSQDQVVRLSNQVLPKLLLLLKRKKNNDHNGDEILEEVTSQHLKVKQLCRLWAGMGHIYLVTISLPSNQQQQLKFVIKHVTPPPPSSKQHLSLGDRRKAHSYIVESNFYEHIASQLREPPHNIGMPKPYLVEHGPAEGEITICMSYLEGGNGVDLYNPTEIRLTLQWLAKFHARFWGEDKINEIVETFGLQGQGSYWYLDTRPNEFDSIPRSGWEGRLKRAAKAIDSCLKRDPVMQCLIHGDPKDANIMKLSQKSDQIVMYDYQYCGKGPPTKDLAYFFCSSLGCDDDSEEDELIEYYYDQLVKNLDVSIKPPTLQHLKLSLEVAYADYCRFMAGWGYWGNPIQERVKKFLNTLDDGKILKTEQEYDAAIRNHFW